MPGLEHEESVEDVAEGVREEEGDDIAADRVRGPATVDRLRDLEAWTESAKQTDEYVIVREAREEEPSREEECENIDCRGEAADDRVLDELGHGARVMT